MQIDTTGMSPEQVRLLSMDLSSVDTSFPLADPGVYDLKVVKSEIVPVRDASKGNMWKLTYTNTTPISGSRGKDKTTIEAEGIQFFDQAILNPMGKAKWDMVLQGVARLVQALKLNGSLPTIESWHKQAEGRFVRAKVSIAPARTDTVTGATYQARNQIEEYPKN
jgi:hypothetical protein